MKDSLLSIIKKFPAQEILVIGDLMLDEYIFGSASRLSAEAPVPIIRMQDREYRLGGAANTAHNLASLGCSVSLIGQVGRDQQAELLEKSLNAIGIKYNLIRREIQTTCKTRIMAKGQQLLRLDNERYDPLPKKHITALLKAAKRYKFIVISDYNKGMMTVELIEELKKSSTKLIVDAKPEKIKFYNGVELITPNRVEAQHTTGEQDVDKAGSALVKLLKCDVVITRSEEGASLYTTHGKSYYVPARAREVRDVSGAGDTFIAALSLAVASGANREESVLLANHVASLVVGKLGTAVVSYRELCQSLGTTEKKIVNSADLSTILLNLQKEGKKLVFTNGCFDILHVGLVQLLHKAKALGDVLIVALNTDESIRRFKGKNRPINSLEDRAEVMATLECVDYVTWFSEDNPIKIIKLLKPDIHVKGGDYNPHDSQNMPEAKVVHEYGGKVQIIPLMVGKSTTEIIKKVRDANS